MTHRTVEWACMASLMALLMGLATQGAAQVTDQALPDVVITAKAPPQATQAGTRLKGQTDEQDDVAQLLRQFSGIQVNRQSGTAGTVLLRGLGGARLPVIQDGIALEGACNHGMDPATSYIAPDDIDQVTVVKGPNTVRHAGVLVGALLFERRNPSSTAPSGLQLSQTIAAFDKQQTHADGLLNNETS